MGSLLNSFSKQHLKKSIFHYNILLDKNGKILNIFLEQYLDKSPLFTEQKKNRKPLGVVIGFNIFGIALFSDANKTKLILFGSVLNQIFNNLFCLIIQLSIFI